MLFLLPISAEAATCFWVGGVGTWSTANAASWSSSTGGAGSTCAATGGIPKQAADTATFDGASGGGTVTVDTTINGVTLTQITMGAFTGTLDFSINNPSVTMAVMSISGAGTRTVKLGSGTFTLTSNNTSNMFDASTITGLTLTAGTSTINFAPSSAPNGSWGLASGGLNGANALNNVTFTFGSSSAVRNAFITGSNTINVLTVGANVALQPNSNTTQILTSLIIGGTSSLQTMLGGAASTPAIISIATGTINLSWAGIRAVTFTGGATFIAANSFDLGNNSGITITGPAGGAGGGHIIGG